MGADVFQMDATATLRVSRMSRVACSATAGLVAGFKAGQPLNWEFLKMGAHLINWGLTYLLVTQGIVVELQWLPQKAGFPRGLRLRTAPPASGASGDLQCPTFLDISNLGVLAHAAAVAFRDFQRLPSWDVSAAFRATVCPLRNASKPAG